MFGSRTLPFLASAVSLLLAPMVRASPSNGSATGNAALAVQADIAVVESVSNTAPGPGTDVTFTVTATNYGPSDATGVQVSDRLPIGLVLVSAVSSVGSYSGTTGLWAIGSLANGASATLTLTATVVRPQPQRNLATSIGQDQLDPNGSNNSVVAGINSPPFIDFRVSLTVDDDHPAIGQDVFFTLVAKNVGPSAGTELAVFSNTPSPGLVFVSASQGSYSGVGRWTIGTLAPGASASLILRKTITTALPVIQSFLGPGHGVDILGGNNAATVVLNPTADFADLAVSYITTQEPAVGGVILDYVVVVTNLSPSPAHSVLVVDNLFLGNELISAVPSQGTCTGSSTLTCTMETLAGGGSAAINIRLTKTLGATVTSYVVVSGAESDPFFNNDSWTVVTMPVDLMSFEVE